MPIGFQRRVPSKPTKPTKPSEPSGYEEEDFEEEPEEHGFIETLSDEEEDPGVSGLAKVLIVLAMGWGVALGILVETVITALEGLL